MLSVMTVKVEEVPRLPVKTPQSIVGYVAVENLSAQRPVSQSQVMARGSAFGLSGMVPGGMRAVTVEVDPVTGVAGLLKAGDHESKLFHPFNVGFNALTRVFLGSVNLALRRRPELKAFPKGAGPRSAFINVFGVETPQDVVRLRTYVVNHSPDKLGPVSAEIVAFYGGATPAANTFLGVQALALPDFLIEIEATAVLQD